MGGVVQRTLCSACRRFIQHRFYTSQALALAPAHVTHPLAHHSSQDTAKTTSSGQFAARRRNPLEPNKVDIYLASLRVVGLEPTIDDINRCRPHHHSHPSSPQYAEDYRMLVDRLCRSFSKGQLRAFALHCGFTSTRSMRKVQLAEAIIEKQWNWPSLKDIEKHRRDTTEVSTKSFPLNPDQLFLILGKDGTDLLQMSMEYNVHMALTPNPLALQVEGVRGSLKRLAERISDLKQGIMEETFELPTKSPIRQDLVQRISRLAGAFIENIGTNGMVRICVKDFRNLVAARRLATRAACEESPSTPLLSYIPFGLPSSTPVPTALFPYTYSLFPFLSPRSFPWTMNAGGAFRIRRVGEWLGTNYNEDVRSTGGLAEGRGHIFTMEEKPCDLKGSLLRDIPETAISSSRTVIASVGHILLASSSPGKRANMFPPLKGCWVFPKILKWLQNSHTKTTFVPSLPTLVLNSPPTEQRILHRLIYRVLPSSTETQDDQQSSTEIIKSEIDFAQPNSPLSRTPVREPEADLESRKEGHKYHDEGIAASNYTVGGSEVETSEENLPSCLTSPPRCWSGTEKTLSLMMPDRPMDVHFSVFDATPFNPGQEPMELQNYFASLRSFLEYKGAHRAQPEPPLTLTHRELTYVLHTSASVRQSNESVSVDLGSRHCDPDSTPRSPIQVVSESILDLESNHKSTVCQVTWDARGPEEGWKDFLRDCDHLTSSIYKAVGDTQGASLNNNSTTDTI